MKVIQVKTFYQLQNLHSSAWHNLWSLFNMRIGGYKDEFHVRSGLLTYSSKVWVEKQKINPQNKYKKSMMGLHWDGLSLNSSFVTLKDPGQILNLSKPQLLYL